MFFRGFSLSLRSVLDDVVTSMIDRAYLIFCVVDGHDGTYFFVYAHRA